MFWRIVNNCEPHELFMDLLLQGSHNTRKQNFYMHQSNQGMTGKFAFGNRLNDIIPLLCDNWLDKNVYSMKKASKTLILEEIPAK